MVIVAIDDPNHKVIQAHGRLTPQQGLTGAKIEEERGASEGRVRGVGCACGEPLRSTRTAHTHQWDVSSPRNNNSNNQSWFVRVVKRLCKRQRNYNLTSGSRYCIRTSTHFLHRPYCKDCIKSIKDINRRTIGTLRRNQVNGEVQAQA